MSEFREEVKKTVEVLRKGGIILYPTDTVWGIGCDATNEDAVKRILDLKGRTAEKGMILLLDLEGRIPNYVKDAPQVAFDLIEFSERPLTIVFDNAHGIASSAVAQDGSIGIRVTKHEFCKQVITSLNKPLVSTSANISGHPFPRSFSEVNPAVLEGVDYVVNLQRNQSSSTTPSKVIRLRPNGEITILRS
ncbi:MAG: L-threonylcarbamoyladenylate synthase [Bacteroidota bacterium]